MHLGSLSMLEDAAGCEPPTRLTVIALCSEPHPGRPLRAGCGRAGTSIQFSPLPAKPSRTALSSEA